MTKQGQEANNPRTEEDDKEQPQSGVEAPAPESGTRQADDTRNKAANTFTSPERKEILTYDYAMAEIAQIEQGDNTAADQFCQKISKFVKRIPKAENGEPGWHAAAREEGLLTKEQSEELAKALNAKIDPEKMKATAERNRAAAERKKANREQKPQVETPEESIDESLLKDIIETAQSTKDTQKLRDLLQYARDEKYIKLPIKNGAWEIVAIPGLKGSAELAQVLNSKREELLAEEKKAAEIRRQNRINGIIKKINSKEDMPALRSLAGNSLFENLGVIRAEKINNGKDWTVHAIPGVEGSEEIAAAVLARKAEIVKADLARKKELDTSASRERFNKMFRERNR